MSTTPTHTLSVLVEDKPGVLARVASLFSRRGYNIQSLAVGNTEQKNMSRMTIVVSVDESPLEQAIGRENLQRYRRALSALKPDEHEAIIGRIEMGYTYQELADTLGKPSADAARKATERALVRLAEELRRVQG